MFPITVLSCTSLLKCLCSRYLSETSKPRRHHLTNHNTRLLSTRQSQPMFTVSQFSRTPNHTPTNNEMGVTRKRDVVLTRLTATVPPIVTPEIVPPIVTPEIVPYTHQLLHRKSYHIRINCYTVTIDAYMVRFPV